MRRTSFRDADILVLTQAQINARFAPFSSTELIINITTKQIKQGPGRWADCVMVLDLSGSGGAVAWGAITGKVTEQEDLALLLDEILTVASLKDDLPIRGTLAELAANTQQPVAGTLIQPTDAARIYVAVDGQTVAQVIAAGVYYASNGGVLRYKAALNQSGTDAPVATVLEDTIGGSWARDSNGAYTYTKNGAFTVGQVWLSVYPNYNATESIGFNLERSNDNAIALSVSNNEDGWLSNHMVLIEVHP